MLQEMSLPEPTIDTSSLVLALDLDPSLSSSSLEDDSSPVLMLSPQDTTHSSRSSLTENETESSSATSSAVSICSSTTTSANNSTCNISSILLRTPSASTLTTRSMPPSTVTFAPLPAVEPRRRNSSIQLGIAARSSMLRNRRVVMGQPLPNGEPGGTTTQYITRGNQVVMVSAVSSNSWSESEEEPVYVPHDPGLGEDAVEDAFLALGKMVKGAGKSLWKKMSHNKAQKHKAQHQDVEVEEAEEIVISTKSSSLNGKPTGILKPHQLDVGELGALKNDSGTDVTTVTAIRASSPLRPFPSVESPVAEEQGSVWEEEISEDLKKLVARPTATVTTKNKKPPSPTMKTEVVQSTIISVRTGKVEAKSAGKKAKGGRGSVVVGS